jgi:hypothetical protein
MPTDPQAFSTTELIMTIKGLRATVHWHKL